MQKRDRKPAKILFLSVFFKILSLNKALNPQKFFKWGEAEKNDRKLRLVAEELQVERGIESLVV